ncbi:MAG: hypothetical protein IK108_02170 [Clostridia bacterium]|nr:hypothetical protein [Clostridia bacterium]
MDLINRFRRFMNGRYGYDQFGRFLFIVSLVFWALSGVLRFTPLRRLYFIFWALNTVLYVYAFFRILSKKVWKRAAENERYLRVRERFIPGWRKFRTEKLDKDYFFKRCPKCDARLRLRRIRGKHTTKCPKCGTKFTVWVLFGSAP